MNLDEIKQLVNERYKGEYRIIREIGGNEEVTIKHIECYRTWSFSLKLETTDLLCPYCYPELLKQKIETYLDLNQISYITNMEIFDALSNTHLYFEFCLLNQFNSVIGIIDIDRLKNMKAVIFLLKNGDTTLHSDINNKKNYCELNDIPLLLISHYEIEKVNAILGDFISKSL